MSAEPNFLDVKIMGRDYRVACTPEERAVVKDRMARIRAGQFDAL